MADLQVLYHSGDAEVTVDTSATTFLTGDALANDGSGNWVLADADVAARQDVQWFCLQSQATGGPSSYIMPVAKRIVGYDRDAAAFTAGNLLYLSATAGRYTETAPTHAIATHRRVVGKAISANRIVLNAEVPHHYVHVNKSLNTNWIDGWVGVADRPMRFIGGRLTFRVTAGGSDATVRAVKAASGTAFPGTAIDVAAASLQGAADTVVLISPNATAATARVAAGDQIGLDFTGTIDAGARELGVTLVFVDEQAI